MYKYYFTYWIAKYGREEFERLTKKICRKITVPLGIRKKPGIDEYIFHYVLVTYYIIALNYFGLNAKQIAVMTDIAFVPGTSKLFPPGNILRVQADVIPEIEKYIENDFKCY